METLENTRKLMKFTYEKYVNGELDNSSLVQLIELQGSLLNLKTIPNYAKEHGMSYNGVKKSRNIIKIFGTKYVLDND